MITEKNFPQLNNFTFDELQKVSSCPAYFNKTSLERLQRAREIAGIPFVITSAYRSQEHEFSHGRNGTSAHTLGRAFDIACTTPRARWKIVHAAITAGFNRIGIGKNFIHVDDSTTHAQCQIWHYYV